MSVRASDRVRHVRVACGGARGLSGGRQPAPVSKQLTPLALSFPQRRAASAPLRLAAPLNKGTPSRIVTHHKISSKHQISSRYHKHQRAGGVDGGVERVRERRVRVRPGLLEPEEEVPVRLSVEAEVEAAGLGHLRTRGAGRRAGGRVWGGYGGGKGGRSGDGREGGRERVKGGGGALTREASIGQMMKS